MEAPGNNKPVFIVVEEYKKLQIHVPPHFELWVFLLSSYTLGRHWEFVKRITDHVGSLLILDSS